MEYYTKLGFSTIRVKELSEIDTTLYELEHIKSGARLIYLDREDDNMTFSVGFTTPPENSTGVFHIIEHSVLCGSKRYPLKDPFAELLKGSLNTFLNAITYEDRTVYPVSSRCEKDFLNLVDVYMDAVFQPNLKENPSIFRQEGWHYEYDEEKSALSINGVVYNEMKGAYSSPDELGIAALQRNLFSDCIYCHDSGGNPEYIPSLTYEYFKEAHEKYYHPSGAKIILDGKMDLEKVLSLLDSHLSAFDRREPISLMGKSQPKISPTETIMYEISDNESETGKARVLYGYVYSDFSHREDILTASIICDLLCGSNASPLKKALLDKGLAKDAAMYSMKSREQTVVIEIRDADETRLDEIEETISNVINSLSTRGIEKDKLLATLNSIEFKVRERDYGTLPTGIANAMSIYGSWMYGGAPEDPLLYEDLLKNIREKIDSDYFEKELLKMTLNNPHQAKIIMLPDKTLGQKSAEEEKKRLDRILKKMSKEELEGIKAENIALREWQNSDETHLADCLPTLDLSDIPNISYRPSTTEHSLENIKILKNSFKTKGIVYISLFFDASDLKNEELFTLSMLANALLNFPTENYDTLSFQNEIKANLGSLFASCTIGKPQGTIKPYLKIGASALTSKSQDIVRFIKEMLTSKIDDPEEIGNIVAQFKSHIEDAIVSMGDSFATSRVEASYNESGAISEYLSGYEAYKVLSEICDDKDKIAKLTEDIQNLLYQLAVKNRLTIIVTGDASDSFLTELISIFPDGDVAEKKHTDLCAESNEFIVVPSKVSYAVIGGKSEKIKSHLGSFGVARSILSYEYLWNTVRVQNGAYGTGFVPRKDGSLHFYSYRDPSPANSLNYYRESANYLRSIADAKEDITKFIIGAYGEIDILMTPRVASQLVASDYMSGFTAADDQKLKRDMLNTKAEDLYLVADIIDEALSNEHVAIVGSAEHLSFLSHKPKRVIKI